MNRIAELIKSVSVAPSVIVHIGAGTCSQHDLYKVISSDRIIYVEADQHLAEVATDSFQNTSQVKVIPCAIDIENGQQTLNITNNRRFSSLLSPAELLDFYPNIEVETQVEVEAITLARLCRVEEVNKDSNNLLVAELQGVEKGVFASAKVDTLQKFKWVIIRSSKTDLYTPVSDNEQRSLSEVLQKASFTVLAFEDAAPPFMYFLCLRDDAAIDNKRLLAQEASLLKTSRVLKRNLSEQKADIADLRTSHATAIDELESSLASKSNKLSETKTLIQSITSQKGHQQQNLEEMKIAIDAKSSELTQAQKQIQSLLTEKEDLKQKIKKLVGSVSKKENELTEMQQTLKINNKLTLKSDMDLRDLQEQYRTALQHQDQQHMLLSELKEKLRQASAFYHKLNLQNLVIETDMLEQDESESDKEHDY